MTFEFSPAAPEDLGVPSEAVAAFERLLSDRRVRMHGYLMLSGNRIIAERYWPPYGPEVNHRMYSVAKSFTALAVGLLMGEGKIALTDPICKYFPDKLPPAGPHPWCAETTVEDMLTMRTCHGSTTYKRYEGDWTESFFRVEPDHIPGTVFAYDTSATHVLAALTERITGMRMLDYLRKNALNELGFSKGAYILPDPSGVSQGGSGLMCTLRDVARTAYLCLHGGVYDGRELLPREFMDRALQNHVPTDLQSSMDEQFGYGYFFWMARKRGFAMYGMGGQLALCFPEADFCLATMADTIGDPAGLQKIYDSFYETVWPCLNIPDAPAEPVRPEPPTAFSGRYIFYGNPWGWRRLELDPVGRMLRLETMDSTAVFRYNEDAFLDGQTFPGTAYPCQCRGTWRAGHFILTCFVTGEEQGHIMMDLASGDTRLGVRMTATGEPFFRYFRGFASAYKVE